MSLLDWLQHSQDQILYLTGKSGCGKSSLLEAFVIPQLKSSAPSFVIFKIRAYQDPLNAVRQELCRPGVIWQQSAPGDTVPISTLLEIACADVAPRPILIVVDQFEEFVILRNDEQQAHFAALLNYLYQKPIQGLTLLFVMRGDYMGLTNNLALPKFLQEMNWITLPPSNRGFPMDTSSLRSGCGSALSITRMRRAP
jgi:hypothetical protein